MAYIDATYFSQYTNTAIESGEFNMLANRASDVIDSLTMHRIGGDAGLALLPSSVQEAVKKSTAAQVETLYLQGGIDVIAGGGNVQSAAIGKFNYSSAAATETVDGIPLSPLVKGYLSPTGLLYRGICRYGEVIP